MNFVLPTWDEGTEQYLIQSEHGFAVEENEGEVLSWHYEYPGECDHLLVHFSELTDQSLVIRFVDQRSGRAQTYYAYNDTTLELYTNAFTIEMTLHKKTYSPVQFGFGIDMITVVDPKPSEDCASLVFGIYGDDDDKIVEQVKENIPLTIIVVGDEDEPVYATVAVYDGSGRFLGFTTTEAKASPQGEKATLPVPGQDEISQVKVLLSDQDWTPLGKHHAFSKTAD